MILKYDKDWWISHVVYNWIKQQVRILRIIFWRWYFHFLVAFGEISDQYFDNIHLKGPNCFCSIIRRHNGFLVVLISTKAKWIGRVVGKIDTIAKFRSCKIDSNNDLIKSCNAEWCIDVFSFFSLAPLFTLGNSSLKPKENSEIYNTPLLFNSQVQPPAEIISYLVSDALSLTLFLKTCPSLSSIAVYTYHLFQQNFDWSCSC